MTPPRFNFGSNSFSFHCRTGGFHCNVLLLTLHGACEAPTGGGNHGNNISCSSGERFEASQFIGLVEKVQGFMGDIQVTQGHH